MGELNDAKIENERLKKKIEEMERGSVDDIGMQEKKVVEMSKMMELKKKEFEEEILNKQSYIDHLVNRLSVAEKTSNEDKEMVKVKEAAIQLLNVEKKKDHESLKTMEEECRRLKEEIMEAKEKEVEMERKEKVLSNSLEKTS